MLDRGRRRWGGGDPYDAAGRRVLVTLAVTGVLVLALVALRAGYAAAQAVGLPPWPIGLGAAAVAVAIVGTALWWLGRSG